MNQGSESPLIICTHAVWDFLSQIVIGNGIYVHHFEPRSKQQSIEGHHIVFVRKEI
jgi:hypothetical protein